MKIEVGPNYALRVGPFYALSSNFQDLNDPRVERTRKHPLINIVFMAVCGVLSGANSFASIHEFALDRKTWFAPLLST